MEFFLLMCATLCSVVFSLSISGQTDEVCNGRIVSCFVDPCSVASCPSVSNAECVPNFCNRCSATFVVRGVTVSEADCGGTPLSQTSGVDQVITKDAPILGGLLGRLGGSGSQQQPSSSGLLGRLRGSGSQQQPGRSPVLGRLFGNSRSSGGSGSQQELRTPPIFRDIITKISNWQPMDANARNKMESFLGGLLNKVFSRLG